MRPEMQKCGVRKEEGVPNQRDPRNSLPVVSCHNYLYSR